MKKFKSFILPVVSLIIAGTAAAYYFGYIPVGMASLPFNTPDHELLRVIDKVPIGSNYDQIKEVYPSISPLQGQGGYLTAEKSVFTEAFAETKIFDQTSKIKFNFNNGKLYSYYYDFFNLKEIPARTLFDDITNILSKKYHKPVEETMQLNSEKMFTNFWDRKNYSVAVTITTTDSVNYHVSTGYQKAKIQSK